MTKGHEPHVAGHATHFLRRLDRASDRHVELALVLYRDPELVAEVLRRSAAPDDAARVAIALDPGPAGPFVVVTRDGKFVTCLAAGMSTGDLFVVGFDRFAHAAAAVDRMRERLEEAGRLEADRSEARRLFRVVERAGPQLAREDFVALARWEPLLEKEFVVAAVDSMKAVQNCIVRVLAVRPGHATPADRKDLRALYGNFWIWSHFSILMNLGDVRRRAEELDAMQRSERPVDVRKATTIDGMRFGIVLPSARALWATGRQARDLLPSVKAIALDPALVTRAERTLGLALIAHASSKARAEARKALDARPPPPATEELRVFESQWAEGIHGPLVRALELGTEAAADAYVLEARTLVANSVEVLGELPVPVRGPEDVPPDVACAILMTSEASWVTRTEWLVNLASAVPWLARAEAADLFLPRAWAAAERAEPKPADLERFATDVRALFGTRTAPRVAERKPGRNDPCSCGSGKKYKVCCARAG